MKKLYILFFTILITSFTFSQELLLNGNFESWDDANTPTNYSKAESTTQEATEIHGGTYSAKQIATATRDIAQDISGIVPGNSYTITIWYKVEAGDGSDARIWSYWLNGTSTVTDINTDDELRGPNNSYFDNNGGVWSEYTVTVTAPTGVDGFRWEVRAYSGSTVYWDDFSFFAEAPSTDPTLFLVDGPTSGSTMEVGPEDLAGDLEFGTTNFVVDTPSAGDGYITWSIINFTDGGAIHASGEVFDTSQIYPFTPLDPNKTYTLTAELVDNSGASLSSPVVYTITANTLGYNDVTSVADLRAVTDNGYYRLTTEAFLTFQQSFRGQKFIQDATGGILIDDNDGIISSTYAVNDGITNIRGQVSEFSGMKQLIPSADYGAPSSTGTPISPQTVTLADLIANAEQYESELVKVISVTIDNSVNATFINGAEYLITQSSNNFNFRTTFYDVDYISATVPITATDIVGIVNERSGSLYYLTARNANDFSVDILSNDSFESNNFKFYPNPTNLGYVNISSKNNAKMSVAVFDILGKQVLNKTVSNNTLDVSGLTSGIYIMKVSQDNASITKKLVIQ